jgi:hypothetical protein
MQVSHHPDDAILVFSLWEGDRCRATFRLPAAEVPRLLHDLVDVAATQPAGAAPCTPATSGRELLRRAWRRMTRRRDVQKSAAVSMFRDPRR